MYVSYTGNVGSDVGHAANDASPPSLASNHVAWPFAPAQLRHNIVLEVHRDEDNLGAGSLGHVLERLQLPDLHGRWRSQNVGSLPHEPSRIHLRAGSNDFGFTNPLLLRGRGKRGGNVWGEDDILDEDTLDGDTPLVSDITNDFGDLESDDFALGHDALDSARTDDVAKGCLGALHESLTKVGDTEGSAVRVGDLEVDDRIALKEII